MSDVYTIVDKRKRTSLQSEKAAKGQKKNNAGGYVFKVTDEQRIKRFLVIGSADNTFYAQAKDITQENAKFIIKMAKEKSDLLLSQIVSVSVGGLALRQNSTIFAYAIAVSYGTPEAKAKALSHFNDIIRTATHLFMFMKYVKQFRGMGRALRTAISKWYLDKPVDSVAYQMVKYRNREGWTHRDVLRVAHPKTEEKARKALFSWAVGADEGLLDVPKIVHAYEISNKMDVDLPQLIRDNNMTWEMISTDRLNNSEVLEALVEKMPLGALLRQLPRLTNAGLLNPLSDSLKNVLDKLDDEDQIKKSRIHPMAVLVAYKTYSSGGGWRSDNSWKPNQSVVAALNNMFYKAFQNVEPSGKRHLIGLDVSGSMDVEILGTPLSAREATAAMAMIQLRTEPQVFIHGFTSNGSSWYSRNEKDSLDGFIDLAINKNMDLNEVLKKISMLPFGGTDCSIPMTYAKENGIKVDVFQVYTDSETWAGRIHPFQALKKYREATGINAKLVVVGTTSTQFSIADPNDAGMLDVVGFSPDVPKLIADFSRD